MTPIKDNISFIFPGQGSQYVGMGQELANTFPIAKDTYLEADDILHFPLSQLAWEGPKEQLNDTINTQPALLVHSIASLRVLNSEFPEIIPSFVAGHSLGELSALVSVDSLSYEDGLHLVRTRGELMKAAGDKSPGGMAAVLGLDLEEIVKICAATSQETDIVQVANDNCPGQVVISGSSSALERAMTDAKEAGARRVVRLAVSIASHSPLMDHAQSGFNQAVDSTQFTAPNTPVIGNVKARPLQKVDEIRNDLQDQLHSRVRWTESIQYLRSKGVTTFIELGSNKVLTGLLKRIDRQTTGLFLGEPEDLSTLLSEIK
jgi:[acyl-carrier-protein] S-malonyltransferase